MTGCESVAEVSKRLRLPQPFLAALNRQFIHSGMSAEWEDFLASFDQPLLTGMRGNRLKQVDREILAARIQHMGLGPCQPVPWSQAGVVLPAGYQAELSPGRHPYYHAGLFYIQEASAMLPAEVMAARPGERVLDLCAAPGGKSTRLAESMQGRGLLFCNEIHPARSRALIRNLEKHGVPHAIVLTEDPERLAERLSDYFDRILVDAPCSGEGMFRRDRRSMSEWERYGPSHYAPMQDRILAAAHRMLRPGGILVYSTCTFSHRENEGTVARFLDRFPDYEIQQIPLEAGMSPGISLPDEGGLTPARAGCVVRIWPHRSLGEGHFCAKLQKGHAERTHAGGRLVAPELSSRADSLPPMFGSDVPLAATAHKWIAAADSWVCASQPSSGKEGRAHTFWHWLPEPPPLMAGLRVAKPGLFLGLSKGGNGQRHFEPSHSLLLALRREEVVAAVDMPLSDDRVLRYIRGETLAPDVSRMPSGRFAVFLEGYPLGWARYQPGGQIKNNYPKAWRRLT